VRGDATVPAISAASILAKTARDAEMRRIHEAIRSTRWIATRAMTRRPSRGAAVAWTGQFPSPELRAGQGPARKPRMSGMRQIASRDNAQFKALRALAATREATVAPWPMASIWWQPVLPAVSLSGSCWSARAG
jgi:hypothetical protein